MTHKKPEKFTLSYIYIIFIQYIYDPYGKNQMGSPMIASKHVRSQHDQFYSILRYNIKYFSTFYKHHINLTKIL